MTDALEKMGVMKRRGLAEEYDPGKIPPLLFKTNIQQMYAPPT